MESMKNMTLTNEMNSTLTNEEITKPVNPCRCHLKSENDDLTLASTCGYCVAKFWEDAWA